MSEITVNIDDYLSEDAKARICREKFAEIAGRKCQEDFERIIKNSAYEIVRDEVDKLFDGNMEVFLKQQIEKVVAGLSAFTVFNGPDAWDKTASKGWHILQDAVQEAAPLIHQRVAKLVTDIDDGDLAYRIQDLLVGAIMEKLKS